MSDCHLLNKFYHKLDKLEVIPQSTNKIKVNIKKKKKIICFIGKLNTEKGYLEPPFEGHYIIVNQDKQLIDGTRRACTLLANQIEYAPAAWII